MHAHPAGAPIPTQPDADVEAPFSTGPTPEHAAGGEGKALDEVEPRRTLPGQQAGGLARNAGAAAELASVCAFERTARGPGGTLRL